MNKRSSYIINFKALLNVLGLPGKYLMLKGRLLKPEDLNTKLPLDKYLNFPKVTEG